ncbi:MAG: Holliday junction branch migration protein RuvA [Anaerolineales bacterium]|jgi:Holliday junction DNA helicase RuvA
MIATLKGRIAKIGDDNVILEVSGVGIRVYLPTPLIDKFETGESTFLHTHLVVREDSLTLFGFDNTEGREYFELLLGVSGIGPRLALSILSHLNPDAIRRALFSDQPEIFSRVPGIGMKTAQKMILHLQDRVKVDEGFEPVAAMSRTDSEVVEGLINLGYSVVEAQAAVQAIPRDAPDDVGERLRLALSYFSS